MQSQIQVSGHYGMPVHGEVVPIKEMPKDSYSNRHSGKKLEFKWKDI